MGNKVDVRSGAITSIGQFTNRPDLYKRHEVESVIHEVLKLAINALVPIQKRALSYKLRYTKCKKGDRGSVRDEWNSDREIRFLGKAPNKKSGYKEVH